MSTACMCEGPRLSLELWNVCKATLEVLKHGQKGIRVQLNRLCADWVLFRIRFLILFDLITLLCVWPLEPGQAPPKPAPNH